MKDPDQPATHSSWHRRSSSLSQKLRGLGRIISNQQSNSKGLRSATAAGFDSFEITHAPDYAAVPVTPDQIPSEEECRYILLAMQAEEAKRRRRESAENRAQELRSPMPPDPGKSRAPTAHDDNPYLRPFRSPPPKSPGLTRPNREVFRPRRSPPPLEGNFENPRPAPSPYRFSDTARQSPTALVPPSPRSHIRHASTPVQTRSGRPFTPPYRSPLLPPDPPALITPEEPIYATPLTPRRGQKIPILQTDSHFLQVSSGDARYQQARSNTTALGIFHEPGRFETGSSHNQVKGSGQVAQQMRFVSPTTSSKEISLRSSDSQNSSATSLLARPEQQSRSPSRRRSPRGLGNNNAPSSTGDTITPSSTPVKATTTQKQQQQRDESLGRAIAYIKQRMDRESEVDQTSEDQRGGQQQVSGHQTPPLRKGSRIVRIGEVDHPTSQLVRADRLRRERQNREQSSPPQRGQRRHTRRDIDDILKYYFDDNIFTPTPGTSAASAESRDGREGAEIDADTDADDASAVTPREVFDLRKLIRESLRSISEERDAAAVEEAVENSIQRDEATPTSPVLSRLPGAIV